MSGISYARGRPKAIQLGNQNHVTTDARIAGMPSRMKTQRHPERPPAWFMKEMAYAKIFVSLCKRNIKNSVTIIDSPKSPLKAPENTPEA